MNQKIILTFLIIFLIASFSWLAFAERKQQEIDGQWFLYFQNPTNKSLDFVVENYTDDPEFSWKLLDDNNKEITNGKVKVLKNNKKTVILTEPSDGTTIKVSHRNEHKSIYKK